MRESCTYGSVRGAGSNPRPYRDAAGRGAVALNGAGGAARNPPPRSGWRVTARLRAEVRTQPHERRGRGRDGDYSPPPAQIRTCSFPAYGSHLGSKRATADAVARGQPALVTRLAWHCVQSALCWLALPLASALRSTDSAAAGPLCSPASQLLRPRPTSRVRASSATARRLPDADQTASVPVARRGISQFPTHSFCT